MRSDNWWCLFKKDVSQSGPACYLSYQLFGISIRLALKTCKQVFGIPLLIIQNKYPMILEDRVDWGKEADWGKKTFCFKIEKLLKNKKILSPCGEKHCE